MKKITYLIIFILLTINIIFTGCSKEKETRKPDQTEKEILSEDQQMKLQQQQLSNDIVKRQKVTATEEDLCMILFTKEWTENYKEDNEKNYRELWQVRSDGKEAKKLFSGKFRSSVIMSPDRKKYCWMGYYGEHYRVSDFELTVYDTEKDTVYSFFPDKENRCWYPQWFDNNNIFFSLRGDLYKMNIFNGKFEKLLKTSFGTLMCPMYYAPKGQFVEFYSNRMCRFSITSSTMICTPLKYKCFEQEVPSMSEDGKLFGYRALDENYDLESNKEPMDPYIIVSDNFNFVYKADYLGKKNAVLCPYGKWIYYIEREFVTLDGETKGSDFIIKRKNIKTSNDEIIYFEYRKQFNDITCYSLR